MTSLIDGNPRGKIGDSMPERSTSAPAVRTPRTSSESGTVGFLRWCWYQWFLPRLAAAPALDEGALLGLETPGLADGCDPPRPQDGACHPDGALGLAVCVRAAPQEGAGTGAALLPPGACQRPGLLLRAPKLESALGAGVE